MLKALTGGSTEMPKNWNRRFKHNRDKMKTGDIFELAEVVRNLSLRDHEKGLSTGEKQMFVKAKKILASELMYAKDMDEDEARRVARGRSRPASRRQGEAEDSGDGQGQALAREPSACSGRPQCRWRSRSVWALLVAAGAGERLGGDRPKAFAALAGRPLLAESLERLEASGWVDAIVVAAPAGLGGAGDPARRGARRVEGGGRA